MSASFRWVVYDIALSITQSVISLMDQKSWPAPAADAPKHLIYKAEKDWKKDGLNPLFFLGWPHVANSFSPGATSGATAMCTRGCVDAWMRGCVDVCVCVCVRVSVRVVVSCSPECTRGGLEGRLSVIV